jgi:hypothetical protein
MDLTQLVTTDPDSRGYAAMTDGQIDADIRDKRHTKRGLIPLELFAKALFDRGILLAITQARLDSTHAAHATALLATEFMKDSRENGLLAIDMDSQAVINMMNALITAELMVQSDFDAIDALATQPASLADIHSLEPYTHLDIAKITGGMN